MTEYEQPQREEQDELVRAVQAVRRTPVPQGPPPQVKAAILEKMRSAAREPFIFRLYERIKAMKPRNKFFAAASLLISLATIAAFLVALAGRPAVAFADVKEQIQKAKNVQMTVVTKMPMGESEVPLRMKMLINESGKMRIETVGQNVVAIYDPNKKTMLVLDPNSKTALQIDIAAFPVGPSKEPKNFFADVRKTLDGNEKPLGEREVDGRMTEGFFITKDGQEMELWADKTSGAPALIKMDVSIPGMKKTSVIIRDIILNGEMPETLFSLQAPEGYTLKKQNIDMNSKGENDLTDGLALLAKWNGDVFPTDFQSPQAQLKSAPQEFRALSEEEQMAEAMKISRMIIFSATHKGEDFHYAGGGVRMGDGNKPIAWWKPKESKNYRVLFGDLAFKDLPAEQVPATGPASEPAKAPKADKNKGKVRVRIVDSAGSDMSVHLLVPKVTVAIKKDSSGELESKGVYTGNEAEKTKKSPDLTIKIHDASGDRATLPACSPIKLTFFDSEEGELASWEGSDAGVTFEVRAVEPAAPKGKAVLPTSYPNFKVTIIDKDGNSRDITRYGE